MKGNREKRRLSAGTILMLVLLVFSLGGSALVLIRLSSGAEVDLSRLKMNLLNLQTENPQEEQNPDSQPAATVRQTEKTESSARITPTPQPSGGAGFTLTVGGSVAFAGELRSNSWSSDAGAYDYSDVMMLLSFRLNADLNLCFLENILSDSAKVNDTVAPGSVAALLKTAGFTGGACGFAQGYAKGAEGIMSTRDAFQRNGLTTLGLRDAGNTSVPSPVSVGGVRTSVLQYTATVSSKTRKAMEKAGESLMMPDADSALITQEIQAVREAGAEAVIVLLNWGSVGKDVTRAQRTLAEEIARAGADLIVGCGSRVAQSAEFLSGRDSRKTLCVWSLGSLLTGDRGSVRRIAGYLLHVTVKGDGAGGVTLEKTEYTPVYAWKYKQDSRFYYRCVAANRSAPDGMDAEQRKNLEKAAATVAEALNGSPLTLREE